MTIDSKILLATVLLVVAGAAIAGCAGTTGTTTATQTAASSIAAGASSPGGTPPDMAGNGTMPAGSTPPQGTTGSSPYTLSGAYTVSGTTETKADATFASDADDVSAIYVTGGGSLTLIDPTVRTSGDTSSSDDSSFYGLNAAVLVNGGSTLYMEGGTIASTGTGANGVIPTGTGTSVALKNATITASGGGGHGVMATQGGSATLVNVNMTTTGSNGAPIATDRGSGTVDVTGGTVVATGADSPGIYSTGNITVRGATITATNAEAAVVEGKNSIALEDTVISGAKGTRDRGIMLYQSMSGDADTGTAYFTMIGGTYTWTSTTGPAFYVTNTNAVVTLKGVTVDSSSPVLLRASADGWGTSGSNGGTVSFVADGETLAGGVEADGISSISLTLQNGTALTGAINGSALSLDSSSSWIVTGTSYLTGLADGDGSLSNIDDNGYTIYYDPALSANSWLDGKTVTLSDGGRLAPE